MKQKVSQLQKSCFSGNIYLFTWHINICNKYMKEQMSYGEVNVYPQYTEQY